MVIRHAGQECPDPGGVPDRPAVADPGGGRRDHGEHLQPAGLGRLLLTALNDRDYPMVSGINLFFATGVVGINLLIDLVYAVLDPRVRYD